MHPAAVLDALVDGVGFVKSRATTFRGSHNAGATVVILGPNYDAAVPKLCIVRPIGSL